MNKGSRINADFANCWSGRWESNPRPKLGKLLYCHCTTPARCDAETDYTQLRLGTKRGQPFRVCGLFSQRRESHLSRVPSAPRSNQTQLTKNRRVHSIA